MHVITKLTKVRGIKNKGAREFHNLIVEGKNNKSPFDIVVE